MTGWKFLRRWCSTTAIAALLLATTARPAAAELLFATDGSTLVQFDSTTPGTVTPFSINGLQPLETLVGLDLRPANGVMYGIGSTNRVYTVNDIGDAFQVGAPGTFTLNGTSFGTDFNPVPDRIRQVSNTEQNLRLNPNDGTLSATDAALNPAGNVVAVAYNNNFAGATQTTLYGIDSAAGTLVMIGGENGTPSPNGGAITTIGSLGLGTNLNEAIGFDIAGLSGVAYASITTGGVTRLYTINLATGAATSQGAIGTGATPFLGLTAGTSGRIITGLVRTNDLTPVAGVTVTRTDSPGGGNAATAVTNVNGTYQFVNVPNGLYNLTASKAGFTFSPATQGLRVNNTNRAANFIATSTAATFSVSGRIVSSNGQALPSMTVTLTGAPTPEGVKNPIFTNSAGYFTFLNVPAGTYTITPSQNGVTFSPSSRSVTVTASNVAGVNFIGSTGFLVTGRLYTSNGAAIAGATVQLDGATTVTTNSAGYYTFYDVANGAHTLTPSFGAFTFAPPSRAITVAGSNLNNQNFVGTP